MNNRLLNINILDHPSNHNKVVIFYTEAKHAEHYKELLLAHDIPYEYQIDEEEDKHYFGFEKRHQKQARKLNYLVFAKFRKPFIPSKIGKGILLSVTLLTLMLAIIGYIKMRS